MVGEWVGEGGRRRREEGDELRRTKRT